MSLKPAGLIYAAEERPPLGITLLQGLQHVCIISIAFIFPVIVVRAMGGSYDQASSLVSMSMMAGGLGSILQALKRGPVGSGYLCPQVCGPSFLSASILAAQTGGLSLVFGMTMLAGFVESLFSRIVHKLRFMFPAEVTGLIVAMVGITVISLAVRNFLGVETGGTEMNPSQLMVALATLAVMVGLNIWGKGQFKLFCVLIGMVVGYLLSWALGVMDPQQWAMLVQSEVFRLPFMHHPGWSFDASLVLPMVVATLCSSLKTVGDLTTCQKINDAEWKRPDMNNIKKGILADGLGCFSAGLLGGVGQSSSSTNIGLSIATQTTSRFIGFAAGGMLMVLAFFPKLAAVFAIMPKAVMGATLVFALSFMVMAGFQIIMSRMLDARKTFVIGLSLIFGLSADLLPEVYHGLPGWLVPLFSSSLSAAAVCAVVLNLIFRIGIAQKAELVLSPGRDSGRAVYELLDQQGRAWGARWEVINAATGALTELYEAVSGCGLAKGPLQIKLAFDELKLSAEVSYPGSPLQFPKRPPEQEDVLADTQGMAALAGYLVGQYADHLTVRHEEGICNISLDFEH